MNETHIQMQSFDISTSEGIGNFPLITIKTSVIFPTLDKQISNINMESLKQAILENLHYQSVSLSKITDNK